MNRGKYRKPDIFLWAIERNKIFIKIRKRNSLFRTSVYIWKANHFLFVLSIAWFTEFLLKCEVSIQSQENSMILSNNAICDDLESRPLICGRPTGRPAWPNPSLAHMAYRVGYVYGSRFVLLLILLRFVCYYCYGLIFAWPTNIFECGIFIFAHIHICTYAIAAYCWIGINNNLNCPPTIAINKQTLRCVCT